MVTTASPQRLCGELTICTPNTSNTKPRHHNFLERQTLWDKITVRRNHASPYYYYYLLFFVVLWCVVLSASKSTT